MSNALWVDATHGAAGDMLLGALLDAGADLEAVRTVVGRLGVEPIEIAAAAVRRHGLRATQAVVTTATADVRRGPAEIAELLTAADLPPAADAFACDVFDRLARAEARVHGVDVGEVHFHEVGALDALADVVGCAVALDTLGLLADGVARIVSTVALGGGTAATEHGRLPVPVPATLELLTEAAAPVGAGPGDRELCTPTGAALLAALATGWGHLPDLVVRAHGSGAGSADPPDRPNLLRVVIGDAVTTSANRWREDELQVLEATVDDLDPRLWPDVLDRLVATGAHDAWLTPVLMRKGRPGHVVTALVPPDALDATFGELVRATTTLGVRVHGVARRALPRDTVTVDVDGHPVAVKRGLLDGAVTTAQPEFDDVRAAADALSVPAAEILRRVTAAVHLPEPGQDT
ncbi:nickel pincer cofactor biosynthesis protein LarC [uncultured Jatrophihabitans sp.]|uniref:nickel pincer cofactor biosynthesis protein LarC n=1 Tax=uncultured Jatrophihabitans sp. TaxID=1610747 RepID=UPI0035CB8849